MGLFKTARKDFEKDLDDHLAEMRNIFRETTDDQFNFVAPQPPDDPVAVPAMLRKMADVYEERQATYGNNYKEFGNWASQLFPNGLNLETPSDWNRANNLFMMMTKLGRYAQNFNKGGHSDSLDDLAVYTTMMQELDLEAKND